MAKYDHTNLSSFRSELKKALASDTTVENFWPDSELDLIIKQALLTFGSLSGFQKNLTTVLTQEDERVYDIFSSSNPSIAPSITYGDIVSWLNIDLIENISADTPTSSLFTLEELLGLIDGKYNAFQLAAQLVNRKTILNVAAQNNLVKLPNDVLDLIRVKFKYTIDSTDYEVLVEREDEETISANDPEALTEEGIPTYYSTIYGSPNEILLYPIPNLTGTLEIIFVGTRDLTQELTSDTIINLPNNLTPYIKFAALEDIYNKDGLLHDPARASYCNKRVNEGITIGKNYSIILTVKSNGLSIETDSLNKTDSYNDNPISSDDPPIFLGLAGINIFETDSIPTDIQNSLLFSVVDNMSIPTIDTDYIDVEIGYKDIILNYCVHLAHFKCGNAYLVSTNNFLEAFVKVAISHNVRLTNKGISYETLVLKSKLEETQFPRLVEANG